MSNYERIKEYYDSGVWSEVRVRHCVEKGILTPEEYRGITGMPYIIGE